MNDCLLCLLDEYDPNWMSNFANLDEAARHFGLEEHLEDVEDEELYEPLDFN